MKNFKFYIKLTGGFVMIPIFVAIFMFDRAILVFAPWVEVPKIQKWMFDPKQATRSVTRIVVFFAIVGTYSLIF
jgi:hypothetical protein